MGAKNTGTASSTSMPDPGLYAEGLKSNESFCHPLPMHTQLSRDEALVGELFNPLEVIHHVVNSGGAGDMECCVWGETWSWSRSPRAVRALAEGSGSNWMEGWEGLGQHVHRSRGAVLAFFLLRWVTNSLETVRFCPVCG